MTTSRPGGDVDGSEEYGRIDISLRLGGPPRVVVTGERITVDDILDASRFLTDLAIGSKGSLPYQHAREQWHRRQAFRLAGQLKAVTAQVRREDYERSRPLRCPSCRRRFKFHASLSEHVAAKHPTSEQTP